MSTLLAQNIPGYITDVETKGGGISSMFKNFVSLFYPPLPDVSLGLLVSRLLQIAIVLAGIFFFFRLISSGYSYLTSVGDPAKVQAASKELTNSTIGLFVIISSFFVIQILQVILGFSIL